MRKENDEMTSQEIKDNAPDTASHYSDIGFDVIYLRRMIDCWECFAFGSWQLYITSDGEQIKPL